MTESTTSPEAPLESWKQIAAHLNRDERTVRRWEKTEGLPVHRHEHLARSTVYAYPSELDAWRESRRPAGATRAEARSRAIPRFVLVAATLVAAITAGGGRFLGPLGLAAQDTGQVHRLVWGGRDVDTTGSITRDGRRLSYTKSGIELVVRDLATGNESSYGGKIDPEEPNGQVYRSVLSPDHETAFILWQGVGMSGAEIRRVDLRTRAVSLFWKNPAIGWIEPRDVSPDGAWLAVQYPENDALRIGLLSTTDATLTPLVSADWANASATFFSPDSRYLAFDLPAAGPGSLRDVSLVAVDGSRRVQVTTHPGDDRIVGWSPDGRQLLFAGERENRLALFAVAVSDTGRIGEPVMVRPDIGHLLETYGVTREGTLHAAVLASAGTVQIAEVDLGTGRVLSAGERIESYLWEAESPWWSPDGRVLAYARERPHGPSMLVIRDRTSGEERSITPDLGEFRNVRFAPDGTMTAWGNRAPDGVNLFRVDSATGAATSLELARTGPTFYWSADGRLIYRSGRDVIAREMASGTETVLAQANAFAISPDGSQLAYIQPGEVGAIMVKALDGEPRRVHELVPAGVQTLGFLRWTADGTRLLFGRWFEDRPMPTAFVVPLDGGPVVELDALIPGHPSLAVHPDGRTLAFETLDSRTEIWAYDGVFPANSGGGH